MIDVHEKKEKRRPCNKDNNDLEENMDKGNMAKVEGLSESFDKEWRALFQKLCASLWKHIFVQKDNPNLNGNIKPDISHLIE